MKTNLKNKLSLADYEIVEKYLNKINKYIFVSIFGGFGLGILVGEVGRKIKNSK